MNPDELRDMADAVTDPDDRAMGVLDQEDYLAIGRSLRNLADVIKYTEVFLDLNPRWTTPGSSVAHAVFRLARGETNEEVKR